MQKLILTLVVLTITLTNYAQDSGISAEIHYPITSSERYTGELVGVLGGAFQFQISDDDVFNYGLEYKFDTNQATITNRSYTSNSSSAKKKMYLYNHLNLFSKINITKDELFKLYLDGGLSVFKYDGRYPFVGYNAGVGLSYDIMDKIYIFSNYNYVKANQKQSSTDYKLEETLGVIRFGVGFNI